MERIHVSVRARPLSADDAKASPWRISGNTIFIPNQSSKFDFDQIFGEDCRTQDVYRARTRDIVEAAVGGFNGTVFAYGQTSSGKTHTMRGSSSEPGVIPLAVHDLFDIIQQDIEREFLLRMSYMEIYNEEINDLLAPEHRKLQIHESIERGIFVAGLREEIVASPEQVLELMEFGESHRHIGETNMNVYSSRSHTIFRMIIESRERSGDVAAEFSCDAVRVSVLNLVDLAGSERAAKTGAEGVRLKEGSHINKSLMTLGTVIKKLSEGAESQGGHVPYRDSKLTRILQPALGGNANTAIICNITLAQIHADETKSSLQFASRALRVTNCAHVNEILTDAALLKRQKKEIEELRAKLLGLHSEHLEEEILNLRNTLLKSELERERISLELEEEKRAQAEREKRLQEQAKKIENLSSMVLCANREETSDVYKKAKRRDTWCPGNLARKKLKELSPVVEEHLSEVKSARTDQRAVGSLLPFEELVKEESTSECSKQEEDCKRSALEDLSLPDPHALLHVTSRRKVAPKKRSSTMESDGFAELQADYENLLIEFETQRIMSDIQIDQLMRKLEVADQKCKECAAQNIDSLPHKDGNGSLRDSDAILVIKQLQEKIAVLEMEKCSSQKQLKSVVDLATEQTISAQEKYEKVHRFSICMSFCSEFVSRNLLSLTIFQEESNWLVSLLTEAEEIKMEFEKSRHIIWSLSSVVDDLRSFLSVTPDLIHDLRPSVSQTMVQIESLARNHNEAQSFLRNKVSELEDEKLVLINQASDLHSRIEELNSEVRESRNAFMELHEKQEAEKTEFQCQFQMLQMEISSLSTCALAKEKENIRKELEKTKSKLKDTEFKLKNAVQEKTKLEGEKACAERELKKVQSQKAMLERDMSKRESIIGRRRDSIMDKGSNIFDYKRNKGSNLAELEEYKKLEVLAFEMEATIASLEDQLATANEEKDIATSRAESLAVDLQSLSDEFSLSSSKSSAQKEEVSVLRTCLEESRSHVVELESLLKTLSEEKEDLSMQFTEALLAMEEEKAIWSSKEKASFEVIEEKEKMYTSEIVSVSQKLSEARNELEDCRKNCEDREQLLQKLEENAALQKQCRCFSDKLSEISPPNEQSVPDDPSKRSPEISNSQLSSECQNPYGEIEVLRLEMSGLRKERQYLLSQVQELEARQPVLQDDTQVITLKRDLEQQSFRLTSMEEKMHNDRINSDKEKMKLRMRLHCTQAKLDTFRVRYRESVDELEYMNRKFESASKKLKKELAMYGTEVLHLKKQLAGFKGQ
ncbi:P-loop containing nucleoside triphosphate hydrolases superfamily protein [Striga hermonthica]|uniref:P-loop containing nucleoside triphosphate hydrolases superfamily protein n=1 Tax=Striga hermonthica TaxID=68872 RepID=A0A9N7R5R0_STRHE|nr:P-loop containing nucleoside triphosphate hydrolases superfamily protein [Striga hermonthica]